MRSEKRQRNSLPPDLRIYDVDCVPISFFDGPGAQRIFFYLFPVETPVGNSHFFVGGRRDRDLIQIALVIESGGADESFVVRVDGHRLGECR